MTDNTAGPHPARIPLLYSYLTLLFSIVFLQIHAPSRKFSSSVYLSSSLILVFLPLLVGTRARAHQSRSLAARAWEVPDTIDMTNPIHRLVRYLPVP
jgi:hypothetical protein